MRRTEHETKEVVMSNEPKNDNKRITNTTRVTVAFPFSTVTTTEPAETTLGLARLLQELAEAFSIGESGRAAAIAERAGQLVVKLGGEPVERELPPRRIKVG
jgi:hypothetical protein